MIGVELRISPKKAIQLLQENGVLALKAGLTIVRFLPPYMITKEDVENLKRTLDKVLKELKPKPA